MVPGDILAVWSEHLTLAFKPQNLTSSPIFSPVGQINDTNTQNYHSHPPKWCITNQKSWYILQHLHQHTHWLQTIFLYMIYSSFVDRYQSFGGMCCLHHWPVETTHLSDTMVPIYQTTWHQISESSIFIITAMRKTNFTVHLNFFNSWKYVMHYHCKFL